MLQCRRIAIQGALLLAVVGVLESQPIEALCSASTGQLSCLKQEYQKADALLNSAYRETMRMIGPANAPDLRTLQREWLKQKIAEERRLASDSIALLRYQIRMSNERTEFLNNYQPENVTYAPTPASQASGTQECWPDELTRRYYVWRDDATDVQFSRQQIANCTYRIRYSFNDDPSKPKTDRDFVAVLRLGDRARYLKVLSQGSGWTPWGLERPDNCGSSCDLPLSENAAYALPLEPDERYTELRQETVASIASGSADSASVPAKVGTDVGPQSEQRDDARNPTEQNTSIPFGQIAFIVFCGLASFAMLLQKRRREGAASARKALRSFLSTLVVVFVLLVGMKWIYGKFRSPSDPASATAWATGTWTGPTADGGLWFWYELRGDGTYATKIALSTRDGWGDVYNEGVWKIANVKAYDGTRHLVVGLSSDSVHYENRMVLRSGGMFMIDVEGETIGKLERGDHFPY